MSFHPRPRYRADIDGLRAVAIVPVVVFHAFPGWAPGGYVGVDVFFVISGYLITSLILLGLAGEAGERTFSLAAFYAGRVRRLFPALALVLVGCLVLGWFVLLADEYAQLGKHVLSGAAFVSNLTLWSESGYFDSQAELKALLHLWSLGIEEQFYIVWPLLLILAARFRLSLLWLLAGIGAASFAANVLLIGEHPAAVFYSPLTRMWELMLGGGLAYWESRGGGALKAPHPELRAAAGLLLIIAAVALFDRSTAFPGAWALLPTLGAGLLISAGSSAWVNRKILASGPLVFIGLVSYPLYLWHWPLLYFARVLQGEAPSLALRAAAAGLAFVLACLTYWLLEKRIRVRKHWLVTASLACVLSVIAGAGYEAFRRDGLEWRLKGSELARVKFNTTLQYHRQCRRDFKFAENAFCLRGRDDRPATVALIGDSHAMTLYAGLGEYFEKRGENLVHFGIGGGIPFYGVERYVNGKVTDYYSKLYAAALDFAAGDARVGTVILMAKAVNYGSHDDALRYVSEPRLSDSMDVFGKAMARTLERLVATKKRVIFVMDNPMLDFDPATCFQRPYGNAPVRTPCAIPRALYEKRSAPYREKVAQVLARFPQVRRWDPAKVLCDDRLCWATRDGKVLYGRDGEHLSLAGSHWFAGRLSAD